MNVIHDIPYAENPAPFGLGDLYLPAALTEKTPLALTLHGGGWSAMDRASFAGVAEFLCENGFAVFNIEYRLTGTSPWPACGEDCLKAAEFLRDPAEIPELSRIQDRRILVVGASAGGHLALMTGLQMQAGTCSGIVTISGVDSHSGFLPFRTACYATFFGHQPPFSETELQNSSPASFLSEQSPPILITHAIYDSVVELVSATDFEDAVRRNGTPVSTYYYNRKNDGHCIWIPGSKPHRLYPDIEAHVLNFIREFIIEGV